MQKDTVAKTIIQQIKGLDRWAFGAWGSHNFLYDENALIFQTRKPSRTIRIEVTPADLYKISISRMNRKLELVSLGSEDDIFCEDLVTTIDGLLAA
jgi:hypothetical protein